MHATLQVVGTGLPASPGAAVGQAVFSAEEAESWSAAGIKVGCVFGKRVRGLFQRGWVLHG
jgi:hypothetical protein